MSTPILPRGPGLLGLIAALSLYSTSGLTHAGEEPPRVDRRQVLVEKKARRQVSQQLRVWLTEARTALLPAARRAEFDAATRGIFEAAELMKNAEFDQAELRLKRALEVYRACLGDDCDETSACYNNLASLLKAKGRWRDALPLHQRALQISRRVLGDDHPDTALCADNLAGDLQLLGRLAEADVLFRNALEIRRGELGDDDPETARSCNNLASNLDAQGRLAEAEPYYRRALSIYERGGAREDANRAVVLSNLGTNLVDQGETTRGAEMLERALALAARSSGANHPETLTLANNLAVTLLEQDRLTEAEALLRDTLEKRRGALGNDHPRTAQSWTNLSLALLAQGRLAESEACLRTSLAIWISRLGEGHPAASSTRRMLMMNLLAQGRVDEADSVGRRGAADFDQARRLSSHTGMERTRFLEVSDSPFPVLAVIAARQGRAEEAWQFLEHDLGRGLLDELASRQEQRLSTEESARLHDLAAELDRLERLMDALAEVPEPAERTRQLDDLSRRRERAQAALGAYRDELGRRHGLAEGKVAALAEVQSALDPDTALIGWLDVGNRPARGSSRLSEHWGFVVRAAGPPGWVRLPGTGPGGAWTEPDESLPKKVLDAVRKRPELAAADVEPLLARLRAQRLEPLEPALAATREGLQPARRLVVLPSSSLIGIPVDALLRRDDPRIVSYAPSASVLAMLLKRSQPAGAADLLALGDPLLRTAAAPNSFSPGPDRVADLEPLPGSHREVVALARLFQQAGRGARTLLGANASEPEVDRLARSGELGRFGFVHLATHCIVDNAASARSAVILSQTGLPDPLEQVLQGKPPFDGRVSVREIQSSWALNANLVTLSACETALGRKSGGEGFVGFTQALLISGARSACLSLWRVDDQATALFMERFYQNLLGRRAGLTQPMTRAQALADARAHLRTLTWADVEKAADRSAAVSERSKGARPRRPVTTSSAAAGKSHPYEHPYYWAAFILVGDPR